MQSDYSYSILKSLTDRVMDVDIVNFSYDLMLSNIELGTITMSRLIGQNQLGGRVDTYFEVNTIWQNDLKSGYWYYITIILALGCLAILEIMVFIRIIRKHFFTRFKINLDERSKLQKENRKTAYDKNESEKGIMSTIKLFFRDFSHYLSKKGFLEVIRLCLLVYIIKAIVDIIKICLLMNDDIKHQFETDDLF